MLLFLAYSNTQVVATDQRSSRDVSPPPTQIFAARFRNFKSKAPPHSDIRYPHERGHLPEHSLGYMPSRSQVCTSLTQPVGFFERNGRQTPKTPTMWEPAGSPPPPKRTSASGIGQGTYSASCVPRLQA